MGWLNVVLKHSPKQTSVRMSDSVGALRLERVLDSRSMAECNSCAACSHTFSRETRVGVCADLRADILTDTRAGMFAGMFADICAATRADMCADACTGLMQLATVVGDAQA